MSYFDYDSYPRTSVRLNDLDEAPGVDVTTRWDVARNAMARCFYFGMRDQGDEFVGWEMQLALHLMGAPFNGEEFE